MSRELLEKIGRGQISPSDPFSHASYLIDPEYEEVSKFSKIVDKRSILANIGDDRLMRLYQNDIHILTSMFSMAQRDPSFSMVFKTLYYSWNGELTITRANDGLERKLQASINAPYMPRESMQGYGSELNFTPEPEQSLFEKIKNMGKQQKGR